MKPLTLSTIFEKNENISISKEVLDEIAKIGSDGHKILSIYSQNTRALYFYPVNSDVFQIKLEMFPLNPETLSKVMTKISEFSSKVVYSTGMCLIEDKCFWEGFIQEKDLIVDIEEVKKVLSSIEEIRQVQTTKIEK